MTRRWGLQATMTATYVAVTAGVVLLTELVIFGVAALSPPTPLTRGRRCRDSPRRPRRGWRRSWTTSYGKLGTPRPTQLDSDLATGGNPVAAGQARPDGNGGVVIPRLTTAECDVASASFAVVVSRAGLVLASSYPACFPPGSRGSDAQAGRAAQGAELFRPLAGTGRRAGTAARRETWCGRPRRSRRGRRRPGQGHAVQAPSPTAAGGGCGLRRCDGGRACSTWRSPPRHRESAGSPCHPA